MDKDEFYALVVDGESEISDVQRLKSIVVEYPYFQESLFAYLKAVYLHDSNSFRNELSTYSIFVQDRKALFYYILREEYSLFFDRSEQKPLSQDRTDILLNAFFETQDDSQIDEFEYNLSHTTLASSDYFSYIEQVVGRGLPQKQAELIGEDLKHQNIIDSFIEKAGEGISIRLDVSADTKLEVQPLKIDDSEELDDDLFFTETLSKIYIKQHKYEKAYKIIKHLSLNFPKKNTYFADQLSFLEKLIINSKFEDKK